MIERHTLVVTREEPAGAGLTRVSVECVDCEHAETIQLHPSRVQPAIDLATTRHRSTMSSVDAALESEPPMDAFASQQSLPAQSRPWKKRLAWGAGLVAAAIALAVAVSTLPDDGSTPSFDFTDVDIEYGCDDLAEEAIEISKGEDVELLKVRSPRVVQDNRDGYRLPAGNGESLILSCSGQGVFDTGGSLRVLLKWTVDSDGDEWVQWKPDI